MPSPKPGETHICPNCHQPVESLKPNAMLSAVTKQWQHKDCWRASAAVVPPESKKPERNTPA